MNTFILSNYIKPIFLKTKDMSCNCSVFYKNGKKYLLSRNVSYLLGKNYCHVINDKCHTRNFLYEFTKNNTLKFIKEMNTLNADSNCKYFGLEDVRTITWNNDIYFSCTKVLGNTDTATMCFGKIDDELNFINFKEFRTNCCKEKNWVPIENNPFVYIYSFSPLTFVNVKEKRFYEIHNDIKEKYSGSTQVIKYNENFLTLVHYRTKANEYFHKFILFDKNFKVLKISNDFSFFGNRVEFCCDIKYENNKIKIIASINDGLSYYFELADEFLQKTFNNELDNNTFNNDVYNKFLIDSFEIKSPEFSTVQALGANDEELITQAIILNYKKSNLPINEKNKIQKLLLKKLKDL